VTVPARVTLFGHEATNAVVTLKPRSTRWRVTRALPLVGGGLALAPVAALVPPHVPWAAGAMIGGAVLGRRRWLERFTLVGLDARCPRCGAALSLPGPTRLRSPLSLDCESCHHQPVLQVSDEDLPEA